MKTFMLFAILLSFKISAASTDQARGALLGLAYGDALGTVTEMYTAAEIRDVFGIHESLMAPYPLDTILMVRGTENYLRMRPRGLYSDDTQQALALILTLLEHPLWGDRALQTWSRLLVRGKDAGAWRGIGSKFSAAVENLARGVPFRMSGVASSGVGAAMRAAPIAGLLGMRSGVLGEAVVTSSLVTHADLRAAATAYAVFMTARYFTEGVSAQEIRAWLPKRVWMMENQLFRRAEWRIDRSGVHSVSSTLEDIFQHMNQKLSLAEVSQKVVQAARRTEETEAFHPNDPFVLLAGLHAIALAVRDEASPLETLRYIVNLGKDTDTVAAMAGGILGARFGTDWIPIDELKDKDRLLRFADALLSETAPETFAQFLSFEAERSAEERQFQETLQQRQECGGLLGEI